jgi:hypothetical protein
MVALIEVLLCLGRACLLIKIEYLSMTHDAKKMAGSGRSWWCGLVLTVSRPKKCFRLIFSHSQHIVHARIPSQKSFVFPWSIPFTPDYNLSTRIPPSLVAHETLLPLPRSNPQRRHHGATHCFGQGLRPQRGSSA